MQRLQQQRDYGDVKAHCRADERVGEARLCLNAQHRKGGDVVGHVDHVRAGLEAALDLFKAVKQFLQLHQNLAVAFIL